MSLHLQVFEWKVSYNEAPFITLSGRDMQISFKFLSLSHLLSERRWPIIWISTILREQTFYASFPFTPPIPRKPPNWKRWATEWTRKGTTNGSSNMPGADTVNKANTLQSRAVVKTIRLKDQKTKRLKDQKTKRLNAKWLKLTLNNLKLLKIT